MYPGNYNGGYQRPPVPPPNMYLQQQQQQQQQYQRPSVPPPGYQRNSQPSHFSSSGLNVDQMQYQRPPGRPNVPNTMPQQLGTSGVMYQYSNCSGRKKLLLVGINYFNTKNELRGCINDVHNMANFLVSNYGYLWGDIVILTDDTRDMVKVPTRDNIIRAMMWLVKDARPNDSLLFHYSGHGGQTKDLDGDELDGYDDTIYPVDFQQAGMIIDDVMHDIMVRPLLPGVRLTALFDSCHSGTALDLPYIYSTKGVVKEPNVLKDAGSGALNAAMSYARGDLSGVFSSVSSVIKKVSNGNSTEAMELARQRKFSPADVISISGCKDDQTSADSSVNGMATGAMSWSFITTLSQQPEQSYLTLLNNMRNLLSLKYSQKPQLSSSHPIDMNLRFVM